MTATENNSELVVRSDGTIKIDSISQPVSMNIAGEIGIATRARAWIVRWFLPIGVTGSGILRLGNWFGFQLLGEVVAVFLIVGSGAVSIPVIFPRRRPKLAAGNLSSEAQQCVQLVESGKGISRAIALENLARIAMRFGKIESALVLFEEVDKLGLANLKGSSNCGIAACHALLGRTQVATESLAKITNSYGRPSQTAFTAIVFARSGEWAKLGQLRTSFIWNLWRTAYEAHERRITFLLKAFARAQTGQPRPKDLVRAKPVFVDEYAYLTKNWPELREFVETQKELRGPLPVAILKP